MDEDKYRPGDKVFYREDGSKEIVTVLENNSDEQWIKYRLRLERVLRPPRFTNPSKPGHIFDCDKIRGNLGSAVSLIWRLTED